MPWYEYSVRPSGPSLPLVEVVLWHGARRVRLVALIDSGADSSLLDVSYADAVGLDRAAAQEIKSVTASGDEMKCLRWPGRPLELQFEAHRFPFRGAFAEFPANADGMNLLGRRDFFGMFIVQFWNAAEMVSIDLSPDFAKPAPP